MPFTLHLTGPVTSPLRHDVQCTRCERDLPSNAFYRNERDALGRLTWCIWCHQVAVAKSEGRDLATVGVRGVNPKSGYFNPGPPDTPSAAYIRGVTAGRHDAASEGYSLLDRDTAIALGLELEDIALRLQDIASIVWRATR